jgi:hypothetical protein
MIVRLRIPRSIYDDIRRDLRRPHEFAAERVGFAEVRLGIGEGEERLVIVAGYAPVADENYINDPMSGARIDGTAIRKAMTTILQKHIGLFHVHLHDFPGLPRLGQMDKREIPRLVKTFRSTGPSHAHGILLLSEDAFSAWVWLPGEVSPVTPTKATVVGMPLLIRPSDHE